MFLAITTLITALTISAVAIYYSVAGLAAIFASAVIPIIIMGVSLEVGKLVTAVWLHKYWSRATWWLKTYLSVSVLVLMFITSMGIFGFLSKAHIEQTATAGDNSLQIEQLDNRIARQQKRISDADMVIGQLDQAVNTLIEFDRIRGPSGAIAVREEQKEERASLNSVIEDAQVQIADLQNQKLVLSKEQVALEAEVGPIKYIAEFIYGDANKNLLEEAVRWVIIVIIFVFDPLAILLLIASQYAFQYAREERENNVTTEEEGTDDAEDSGQGDRPVVGGDPKDTPTVSEEQTDYLEPVVEETVVDEDYFKEQKETSEQINETFSEENPVSRDEKELLAKQYSNVVDSVEKKDIKSSEEFRLTEEQLDELDKEPTWSEAKKLWKEAHPEETLKEYKKLYLQGKIDHFPWEVYLDQAEENQKKRSYIMKEQDHQIRKTTGE